MSIEDRIRSTPHTGNSISWRCGGRRTQDVVLPG